LYFDTQNVFRWSFGFPVNRKIMKTDLNTFKNYQIFISSSFYYKSVDCKVWWIYEHFWIYYAFYIIKQAKILIIYLHSSINRHKITETLLYIWGLRNKISWLLDLIWIFSGFYTILGYQKGIKMAKYIFWTLYCWTEFYLHFRTCNNDKIIFTEIFGNFYN
jgi:hypothetical protein